MIGTGTQVAGQGAGRSLEPLIPHTPRISCPGQIEHRKERLRVGCGDSCAMIRLTLLSRPIDIQMLLGCGPASDVALRICRRTGICHDAVMAADHDISRQIPRAPLALPDMTDGRGGRIAQFCVGTMQNCCEPDALQRRL